MNMSLMVYVLLSFIAGGGMITFLSLWAERSDERTAGIIMMFPSTIVLGLLFLGLSTSAESVAKIAPATITPLGVVVFSPVIYIHTALFVQRFIIRKITQITLTFLFSSMVWFSMAAPFAVYKFSHLPYALAGYFVLMVCAHIALNRNKKPPTVTGNAYKKHQVLFRAVFTGIVIAVVVLMGKLLNPFWGGIFTMYPAATFAALIIFHFYYKPEQLSFFMRKAPIGSLSLLMYVLSCIFVFPGLGVIVGTLTAYTISLLFSLLLIKLSNRNKAYTR